MNKVIYLAGGMKSNWQDKVINSLNEPFRPLFRFYDPSKHGLSEPDQYTLWDLNGVEKSGVLLGYMEADNPSGYGLALEIGYAKALGKKIILVDERSTTDSVFQKRFDMARSCADVICNSLEDAILLLKSFQ